MTKDVDYVIVGLGNAAPEFVGTRSNAGFIFVDYLSNCVALQSYLIEEVKRRRGDKDALSAPPTLTEEEEVLKDIKGEDGVPKYAVPTFQRTLDVGADIHDVTFELTDDMVSNGPADKAKSSPPKSLRLILVKPLFGMAQSGQVTREVLKRYGITDVSKKLIVVLDDITTLPGSIQIKDPSESKLIGHSGIDSIAVQLGTPKFTRFRIGIGRPDNGVTAEKYATTQFTPENKEMDMLGYALDLTAQALQFYAATQDLKKTKKKFASSKKLPCALRKMEGLMFPIQVKADPNAPKPEEKKEASPTKTEASPAPSNAKKDEKKATPAKAEEKKPATPAEKKAAPAKVEEKKPATPVKTEEKKPAPKPAETKAAPAKVEEKKAAPAKAEEKKAAPKADDKKAKSKTGK